MSDKTVKGYQIPKMFILVCSLLFSLSSFASANFVRDATKEIVRDNISGLMWQDDGATATVKKTWAETDGYCSNLSHGGFDDWRVPSVDELQTIVDVSKFTSAIDASFVNVTSDYYWSSTTAANGTDDAWFVDFYSGGTNGRNKANSFYVRCVRGGQFGSFDTLSSLKKAGFSRDATKEIVHDSKSGLMWQDDAMVKTVTKTWDEAEGYCSNLSHGGFDDWRVPSVNELRTIVDFSKYDFSINENFINFASYNYWSSTTNASNSDYAWTVYFRSGYTYYSLKSYDLFVRCVRGGQFDSFVTLLFKNAPLGASKISIDFDANRGSVEPFGGFFVKDSNITLTTLANFGVDFISWSDGDTANPRVITVDKNITLRANFEFDTKNYEFLVNGRADVGSASFYIDKVVKNKSSQEEANVSSQDESFSPQAISYKNDGAINIDKSQNIYTLHSYSGVKLIKNYSLFKIGSPIQISSTTYSQNPHNLIAEKLYSDTLSKLNAEELKNRWFVFANMSSSKKYRFYYTPTQTPSTVGASSINYTLYKEQNGQKTPIGTKTFSVHEGLSFDLLFDANATYYARFATDANLYDLKYNIGVFAYANDYDNSDIILSKLYELDANGEHNSSIIVTKSQHYDVTLLSEANASLEITLSGQTQILQHNQKQLFLKAGIYTLKIKGEASQKLFVALKKSAKGLEIEPNDTPEMANIYRSSTDANLSDNDEDSFIFASTASSISATLSIKSKDENLTGLELFLLDTNAKEYGYLYVDLNGTTVNLNLSTYPLEANKNYYLKLKGVGSGLLEYQLDIKNAKDISVQSEINFKTLHDEWVKNSLGSILGDTLEVVENPNPVIVNTNVEIPLQAGWNLISADTDIQAFTYPATIVWKYTSTSWQVYSSLASLKSSIQNNALEQITTLSHSDGIWVFAEIGTSLNYQKSSKSSDYLQSYTNKWNLSGTQDDIQTSTLSCSGVAPKSIWKYQNGSWQLNTKVSNTLGLKSFTTINANEGFWVECQ